MFTLFAAPKPFRGHIGIIQRNAICSWKLLNSCDEIILFGDEEGIAEIAREYCLTHIPLIAKNEYGTPLIFEMFRSAETQASTDILCYVNADIILMDDFVRAICRVKEVLQNFLIVGQRWDLDINHFLEFSNEWHVLLKRELDEYGTLHNHTGIDFFVFHRSVFRSLPSFPVGRPYWDNFLIYRAITNKIPVVDITAACQVIHQNHDYRHRIIGKHDPFRDPEAQVSWRLAGDGANLLDLRDATYVLTQNDKITNASIRRYPFRRLFTLPLIYFGWNWPIRYLRYLLRLYRSAIKFYA